MSPRTGRPLMGESKKSVSLQLRLAPDTMEKLDECSETLEISRTKVIEQGIDKIHDEIRKK